MSTATESATHPASLWRNRNYLLLWSGQIVSSIGTQVSDIAFPFLVLALTNSPAQAGFVGAAPHINLCWGTCCTGGSNDAQPASTGCFYPFLKPPANIVGSAQESIVNTATYEIDFSYIAELAGKVANNVPGLKATMKEQVDQMLFPLARKHLP
jgi:hypothetical protein